MEQPNINNQQFQEAINLTAHNIENIKNNYQADQFTTANVANKIVYFKNKWLLKFVALWMIIFSLLYSVFISCHHSNSFMETFNITRWAKLSKLQQIKITRYSFNEIDNSATISVKIKNSNTKAISNLVIAGFAPQTKTNIIQKILFTKHPQYSKMLAIQCWLYPLKQNLQPGKEMNIKIVVKGLLKKIEDFVVYAE